MPKWSPFPLVRITLAFAVGVVAAVLWPYGSWMTATWITVFLVTAYCCLFFFRVHFDIRLAAGMVGLAALCAMGFLHVRLVYRPRTDADLLARLPTTVAYKMRLSQPPDQTSNGWRARGEISAVYSNGGWHKCKDGILLYINDTIDSLPFEYGADLLINSRPSEVPPPYNPGAFDYRQYLAYRGVHLRDFVKVEDVMTVKNQTPNVLVAWSSGVRERIRGILQKYIPGHQEYTVAEALLLGIKNELNPDLKNSYSAAGVMHVLAVSGLHVGILYWILMVLLSPLSRSARGRLASSLIILMALWFYAFVTGLVPSVLRAVTMFSFLEVGRMSRKEENHFNILAASALILLLLDPLLVMNAGFQLSYFAVAGILYMYPLIYHWWRPPNAVTEKIWQVVCVSIAAQVATAPLVLYYFHRFPFWFLLSNLVVVPAAFCAVVTGVALIGFSFLPLIAKVIGYVLDVLIRLMDQWVTIIQSFPGNNVQIHITFLECLLLILAIFCILTLFALRKFRYAVIAFLAMCLVGGIQLTRFNSTLHHPQLVVYRVPGHSAFDVFRDGRCYVQRDPDIDATTLAYNMAPARLEKDPIRTAPLMEQSFYAPVPGGGLLVCGKRRVLNLGAAPSQVLPPLTVDYLVVSHNAIRSLDDICRRIKAKMLVLDSSNSFATIDRLEEAGRSHHIPVYSVLQEGAFVVNL